MDTRYWLYTQLFRTAKRLPWPRQAKSTPPPDRPHLSWKTDTLERDIIAAVRGAAKLPFVELFPDLQCLKQPLRELDETAKQWYKDNMGIDSALKYVKHILNRHDGEMRLVGDFEWEEFPATGGDHVVSVFHPHI